MKTHPDLKITLVHNEKAGSSGSSDELHAIIERAGHRIVRTWEPEALSALAARGGTLTDAAFAGSELTFASVQRFGLSVELGYRRVPTLFAGFETSRLSASLAGHWYIR